MAVQTAEVRNLAEDMRRELFGLAGALWARKFAQRAWTAKTVKDLRRIRKQVGRQAASVPDYRLKIFGGAESGRTVI